MQRIKSQSTCQVQGHLVPSQSRARSKRGTKGQISEVNQHTIEKIKNNNTPFTENSLVSIKSNPKGLAGSMKNLKAVQHNSSIAKNSVQNTSRVLNNNNSGISARILKQIIGYSHKGPNKIKNNSRDGFDNDHKEQVTLQIDLTYQALNKSDKKIQKEEDQPRTTLSQNRKKSQEKSEGKNNTKKYKNQKAHRIVQQFSPLNLSPQKQQIKNEWQNHKLPVIQCQISDKISKINSFLAIPERNDKKIIEESQRLISGDKDLSLINMLYKQYTENKRVDEINLKKPSSPNISNLSNIFDKSLTNRRSPTNFLSTLNKENIQKLSNNSMAKKSKDFDVQLQKYENSSLIQKLIEEKQRLIISLQQSTTVLDQHFELNFKQFIPIWKQIIKAESQRGSFEKQIIRLQEELKGEQLKQQEKKTELFQLNRDQISRRRQKQYLTRRGKNKYLQDAVSCQEGLKLKLSSKADYEHVILFNQKVVLTGQKPLQDLQALFVQMFDNKLSKKFALIAKKQLANLSVYDSRLVQDFLKRIQQLQSCYTKIECQNSQGSQMSQHYSSVAEQEKLQQLVEQIQEIILSVELLNSNLNKIKSQYSESMNRIQRLKLEIQEQILRTNKKISGEYKMIEGYSFDFQLLLQDKYNRQFQAFRKEIRERDQIISKLNLIQSEMWRIKQPKQDKNADVQLSNYSTLGDMKIAKQRQSKKSSLLSTPSKDFMKLDTHHQLKHINFVGNVMEIQTKSHLDQLFNKSGVQQ